MVTTVCYGRKQKWVSRSDAIKFYKERIKNAKGSVRDRYTNILIDLQLMKDVCTDEWKVFMV